MEGLSSTGLPRLVFQASSVQGEVNTYSGISPTALETLWSRLLPTASSEVGELCLEGKDGHMIPTGSLIRLKATS
mgnify:CR=1 FL=1